MPAGSAPLVVLREHTVTLVFYADGINLGCNLIQVLLHESLAGNVSDLLYNLLVDLSPLAGKVGPAVTPGVARLLRKE